MTLRKKWTNSTLKNKKCSECKKTFPRTDEYFYCTPHRSLIGTKNYTAHCIACDNKRSAEYKLKNRGKRIRQDIKYRERVNMVISKNCGLVLENLNMEIILNLNKNSLIVGKNKKEIYGLNCPYFPWIQMTRVRG